MSDKVVRLQLHRKKCKMKRIVLASVAFYAANSVAMAASTIYAQKLVGEVLATHADINALTFHVTPPGAADNIIIASNIATVGKKADADDLSVLATGRPIQEPNKAGTRYGIELQLKSATGSVIGVLAVGYKYKRGDDTKGFLAKAEALRDELAKQIPDAASMMADASAQK